MSSYPTRNKKFQKIAKKIIKKLKTTILETFPAKTSWDRLKMGEKMKIVVLINSYPSCNREFQKNSKKIQRLKNAILASFQAKTGWERPRKRENKNYPSDQFLPDSL